jgi:MarR family transcriptional regulator for hemolysin
MQESSSARELFGFKLVHLARCWRMRLDQQLKHTGLTQSKWNALVYLTRGGDGLLQKDLARYIGIEGPTLVRLLDDLQRQGLIERRPTHRDRRGKTIHLTDAAYPVLTEFHQAAEALRAQLLDGVSEQEMALCIDLFERLLHNLNTIKPAREQSNHHE